MKLKRSPGLPRGFPIDPEDPTALILRPIGLLAGSTAREAVATGRARQLAGGPLAFTAAELFLRHDDAVEIVGIASIYAPDKGDHEEMGVVKPTEEAIEAGKGGLGTWVTLSDAEGEPLCSLVIGNDVPEHSGQRYVRIVGDKIVYTTKVDTYKLSTKFSDWIKDDLLDLNTDSIKSVVLDNLTNTMLLVGRRRS